MERKTFFSFVCRQISSGVNVMISKIFSPKNLEKKLAILAPIKKFYAGKKIMITLCFQGNW
jgi:hypothetical protein